MATLLARGQITIAAIRDGAPGPQGKPGKPGKDAVSIIVEDAPLVFDTDDNGIVSPGTSKTAKVKVMKGNQNVSNQCIGVSSRDDMCVNCKCYVTQEDGYITVSVSGNTIAKDDVVVDGVNHVVSATSGYAVAQAAYDGVTYFAQVPFSINVAKFTGIVAFDNKSYKSKFKEVSNRLDGAATKYELTQAKSEIKQTAREISLSVSEKSIERRNLLVGSDFRKETNDFTISNDARIEMNSGYQGTNCIRVIDDTDGTSHYIGVYWDGSQGGRSIKIEKDKKYTISCYYKTNDSYVNFSIEAIYTDKETNAKRLGRPKHLSPHFFNPKRNQWELFTTVIDTTDAESDYIAFNFWEYCNNKIGRIVAYICRPMVEEGNTYNGWTLSDKDYDYVGANLIDNSRTLDVGGNVYAAKGQKTLVGDAYELTASGSDDYNIFYRIKGSAFKLYTDYTISFEVRGDAKYMGVYVVYPVTNTKFTCYKEQQNGMMTEADGDGKTVGYVALVEVKELSKQQRVWGHFRFKDRLPEELYFQFPKNAKQTDVTSWNVTITKPKIEVGAVVTEYTERKSDLVDKASLKKAGIEVKSDEVLLYGDRIRVDNNGQTAAMFIGGKLNASLIDADKIEVKHLWAKSEDGITKVGYFGNYEIDACKVNNANAPLFVGADTAAKSPFYVTNEGHMVSTSATLGCFLLDKTSLRYISGYDDEEPGFALYNNFMLFREYSRTLNPNTHTWKSERKRTVWLGEYRTTYQLPALLSNLLIDDSFSADDDTLKSGIRISVTGCNDKYQYEDNMYNGVFQSKVYGNFAIYAEHGMYGGLRPMTRTINRSMELTDMDCFVIVTKGVTITLPAKPQRGQYYKFLQTGDNFVIKSSLNNMLWYRVGRNSFTSGALNQTTELIYDGSNWNVNWFIGK